jgi:hypothetical protein
MSYKVAFLNDQDFERLPGKDMDTKIGVAYPNYGEAYIRKSGSNIVDVFTLAHELEHLKGDALNEHFDSENGCYYKGFGDIMGPISNVASMIPGPWQMPAIAYSGFNAMSGGGKSSQPQQMQAQPQMQALQAPMETPAPFTSPAQGSGGGAGAGPVGGSAVKGLSQMPQFENQQYGNYSGRGPLSVFGGR